MVGDKQLIEKASDALTNAYAPYSKIKVGASVATETGEVFSAANVENASYGLTICAERAAIFAAVGKGHRKIKTLAVIADGMDHPLPCGACLQVMSQFGVERVIVGALGGEVTTYDFDELLPKPFSL
jgi:homotetrameric cytidine deaminase